MNVLIYRANGILQTWSCWSSWDGDRVLDSWNGPSATATGSCEVRVREGDVRMTVDQMGVAQSQQMRVSLETGKVEGWIVSPEPPEGTRPADSSIFSQWDFWPPALYGVNGVFIFVVICYSSRRSGPQSPSEFLLPFLHSLSKHIHGCACELSHPSSCSWCSCFLLASSFALHCTSFLFCHWPRTQWM